jgi:hypothetical protein
MISKFDSCERGSRPSAAALAVGERHENSAIADLRQIEISRRLVAQTCNEIERFHVAIAGVRSAINRSIGAVEEARAFLSRGLVGGQERPDRESAVDGA